MTSRDRLTLCDVHATGVSLTHDLARNAIVAVPVSPYITWQGHIWDMPAEYRQTYIKQGDSINV